MATQRYNHFGFILWEESAFINEDNSYFNAFKALEALKVPIIISPCHNSDIDDNGELKKRHYHCIISFKTLKSYTQVQDILRSCNIPNHNFEHLEIVYNYDSFVRYFCHLDNSDKHLYDTKDLRFISCPIDLKPFENNTENVLSSILSFCRVNKIIQMCDLIDYAFDEKKDDWIRCINSNSRATIYYYISSQRYKYR